MNVEAKVQMVGWGEEVGGKSSEGIYSQKQDETGYLMKYSCLWDEYNHSSRVNSGPECKTGLQWVVAPITDSS